MESIFYHTYNRGVEKRKIFLEGVDYFRGVHDIYEFNNVSAITNLGRQFSKNFNKNAEGYPISINGGTINKVPGKRLLDIIAWSFMPNHYHFFSSPKLQNGLSKFQQKFGIGFSNFFNTKYKRSGVLFQGKYKKVRVVNDTQALQLICYIHSNPLELWKPGWKENRLRSEEIQSALNFLEKDYRFSSHLDYLRIKNFPSLISGDYLFNFFGGPEKYREFFINWLKYYERGVESVKGFILEN